ncbi:cytochrome C, class I [Ketogulonicigenium robustum]|uniref:Cytochrome C, class I n=1 Tax=Ketogulonicigenium robustum TaxID=92947 RepID=A0A1W6NWB2_9RHOB|nr:cytochrome c [Ketogulonicigenium robustum]ARO13548.1 cytochrome C, class I [Ketogulonicigenium robustum]
MNRLALPAVAAIALAPWGAMAQDFDPALVERGRYVAIAADCAACHTNHEEGVEWAGGYILESPMGAMVSTNITPSKEFGIGDWTLEQFSRAVRKGVAPGMHFLYPGMPYSDYAQITDDDISALYAFIMTEIEPVDAAPEATTQLSFPFNIRYVMMGWNLLFARSAPFEAADVAPGAADRGEYLVKALAHCNTCHTPRNVLLAEDTSQFLQGGNVGGWEAPNLTSDPISGLGGWSDDEIKQYLSVGHAHGKAQAAGPMAEAVSYSLQYLNDDDLQAIVDFLRTVPPTRTPGQIRPSFALRDPDTRALLNEDGSAGAIPTVTPSQGEELFMASCANCHGADGRGTDDFYYPSLINNAATSGMTASNLVMVISTGLQRETEDDYFFMPAYAGSWDSQQIADVANYVLESFGNPALHVTADYVELLQAGGEKPLLLRAMPYLLALGGIVAVAVLLLLIGLIRARRRARMI